MYFVTLLSDLRNIETREPVKKMCAGYKPIFDQSERYMRDCLKCFSDEFPYCVIEKIPEGFFIETEERHLYRFSQKDDEWKKIENKLVENVVNTFIG